MIYFEGTEKYFILQHKKQNVIVNYNYDCRANGFNFGEVDFYLNKKENQTKIKSQQIDSQFVLFSEDNPLIELDRYNLNQSSYLFTTSNNKLILDIPYDDLLAYEADDFVYIWFVTFENIRRPIMQGTLRLY